MGPSTPRPVPMNKAYAAITRQFPESQAVAEGSRGEQSAEWIWEFVVSKLGCIPERHKQDDGAGEKRLKSHRAWQDDGNGDVSSDEIVELLERIIPRPKGSATFTRRLYLFLLEEAVKAKELREELLDLLDELKELCEESTVCRSSKASRLLLKARVAVAAAITLDPIRGADADWTEFERRRDNHFPAVIVPDTVEEDVVRGVHIADPWEMCAREEVLSITRDVGSRELKLVLDRYTAEGALALVQDFVERDRDEAGLSVLERIEKDVRSKRYRPSWETGWDGTVGEEGAGVEGLDVGAGTSGDGIPGLPASANASLDELRAAFARTGIHPGELFEYGPKPPSEGAGAGPPEAQGGAEEGSAVAKESLAKEPGGLGGGSAAAVAEAPSAGGHKQPQAENMNAVSEDVCPPAAADESPGACARGWEPDSAGGSRRDLEAGADKQQSSPGLVPPWTAKEAGVARLVRRRGLFPSEMGQLSLNRGSRGPVRAAEGFRRQCAEARPSAALNPAGSEPVAGAGHVREESSFARASRELQENTEWLKRSNATVPDPLPGLQAFQHTAHEDLARQRARQGGAAATNGELHGATGEGRGESERQEPTGGRTKPSLMDRQPTARTEAWTPETETPGDELPAGRDKGVSSAQGGEVEEEHGLHDSADNGGVHNGARSASDDSEVSAPRPALQPHERQRFSPLEDRWLSAGGRNGPKRAGPSKTSKMTRQKRKFSQEEEEVLKDEVTNKSMDGKWKLILERHPTLFEQRTAVDLKDKWRNLLKKYGRP